MDDSEMMDTYHKANSEWLIKQGFTPLSREEYERVRKLKIDMMESELRAYEKFSRPGVTFTDKQKEAIQEDIARRKEQG